MDAITTWLELQKHALARTGKVTFECKVIPRSDETAMSRIDTSGKPTIKLKAPPEQGKANEALVRYVAKEFEVPVACVNLLRGATQRNKLIAIERT